jgi:glycerate kinase
MVAKKKRSNLELWGFDPMISIVPPLPACSRSPFMTWIALKMRVLILPDKFKGALTAPEAAEAIARGWQKIRTEDELELLPMSDGGDGFGEVMARLMGAQGREVQTINAAHEPICAKWWWASQTRTAIIESAQVIGLAQLPSGKHRPFELDTFGLGKVVEAVTQAGAERCICGIGGSATNDAGFGVARALAFRFLNSADDEITSWTKLSELHQIKAPLNPLRLKNLQIAVDVQNPLVGPQGASRVYGPQKGLREADFPMAEAAFRALVHCVITQLGQDSANEPGAGAAGGLGYGLRVFLGGHFEPGFSIFAQESNLEERIRKADLVITAEGSIDRQSLMGKGTGAVAQLCAKAGVKCLGLAGVSDSAAGLDKLFTRVEAIVPQLTSPDNARKNAAEWLEKLAEKCVSTALQTPSTSIVRSSITES